VGYDPSLYTTQLEGSPVLVRKMISRGEERLRVGLLRQLHFLAIPASAFEITYRLEMGGVITGGLFTLVSEDGKKYQTALPFSPGKHKARISGEQLHLPPPGVDAEAIVIETQVSHPVRGSDNRLTVCSFSIDSRQIAPVVIRSPHIVRSPGSGISVASRVVTRGTQVQIEFVPAAYGGVLEIMDGSGTIESKENIPAGASRVSIPEKIQSRPGVWRVRIRRGSAVADFRLLVVGDTPTHPRLLLTRERIEQLKSHEASAELKRIVHQRASKLAASIAMNPTAGENIARLSRASPFPGLVPYFNLMEDYSNAIGYNAVDFRLTGDRHALEITRQALLTVAEWSTWTPPWFLASGLHTYYEVGVATQRMAFGYDLVTDEFNPEEQTKIIAGFWRNSIKPTVDDYFLQDTIPTGASNHQAQSVGGAIAAAVVMYGDVP